MKELELELEKLERELGLKCTITRLDPHLVQAVDNVIICLSAMSTMFENLLNALPNVEDNTRDAKDACDLLAEELIHIMGLWEKLGFYTKKSESAEANTNQKRRQKARLERKGN